MIANYYHGHNFVLKENVEVILLIWKKLIPMWFYNHTKIAKHYG